MAVYGYLTSTLLTCLWLSVILHSVIGQPMVVTPVGNIQGVSDDTTKVNSFLGIPYAKPPTGNLRFRKPEALDAFTETFQATNYGQACTQGTSGAEDCLFLNVFVPVNASSENPVPVMVWVHGGAFQFDTASNYKATGLAGRGNVIVVTLNYRLGVMGFLNTEDMSSPGNYGLWDQLLALKWVNKNIGAFGGDLNKITLIGESAGAAGAAYHALSTHSKGLFQRMILQSGTALSPFALCRTPRKFAIEFAERVGCVSQGITSDTVAILDCLRGKDVTDIISKSHGMTKPLGLSLIDFTWVPSVDNDFILDDPNTLIGNKTFLESIGFFDVDLLLGMNNDEGSLIFLLATLNKINERGVSLNATEGVSRSFYENEFIPAIVTQKFGNSTKETGLATQYMYESGDETVNTDMVSNADWFKTYSDATFLSAMTRHALAHSMGHGRTYLYLFDHKISYNTNAEVTGTPHGGDVPFLFGFSRTADSNLNYTKEEYTLSMNVITYWTNMANTGSPNLPSLVPVQWPEFEQSEQKFLKLSTAMSNASIAMGLFAKRAEFWLDFMPAILPKDSQEPADGGSTGGKLPVDTDKSNSAQPRSAQFIERFNIDSATAEGTIIALAVVVAILAAVVFVVIAFTILTRRKKNSDYSL